MDNLELELVSNKNISIINPETKQIGFDVATYTAICNKAIELVTENSKHIDDIKTDDELKACKKERTALNKLFKSVDGFRKTQSKELISKFVEQCKNISDLIQTAVSAHSNAIDEYNEKKKAIEDEVKARLGMIDVTNQIADNKSEQYYMLKIASTDISALEDVKKYAEKKGMIVELSTTSYEH